MTNPYLVYLSGPITGLNFNGASDWRTFAARSFPPHIIGVSPMRAKRYLAKDNEVIGATAYTYPMSSDRAINTRDRNDTLRASAILVNLLGANRVSIGTVMEIAWAYDHKIPVVVAIEPEGNVHDHPMLRDSYSVIVNSLDEAIAAVIAIVSPTEELIWDRIQQNHMLIEENRLDLRQTPLLENWNAGAIRSE